MKQEKRHKTIRDMKSLKNIRHLVFTTMVIIGIVVAAVIILFQAQVYKINDNVAAYTNQYLEDIINESTQRIESDIQCNFTVMEVIAAQIAESENFYGSDIVTMLSEQIEKLQAKSFNIISRTGSGLDGQPILDDILSVDCVKQAFQGENTISDVVTLEDSQEILFQVPIYQQGQIKAVLQIGYDLSSFAQVVGETVLGKKAATFIVQTDGTLVSRPESAAGLTNLFDLLENLTMEENGEIQQLKRDIENGESGNLTLGSDNYKRYICYSQIGINGWGVVTIMSASVVESNIYDVSSQAEHIGEGVIIIFVLLIAYIIFVFYRLYKNNTINYQRYQIAAQQSSNIIFEYYPASKEAYHTEKWIEKMGYEPVDTDYITNMTKGDVVVPEDKEIFESLFEELENGAELVEKQVRIYDKDKNPILFLIKASTIKNRRGQISKVIGRYIDVDRMRSIASLKEPQNEAPNEETV
jgi:PAS domain-containing protein